MPNNGKYRIRRQVVKQSPMAMLPVIAICGVVVASCIAFGNPNLWMTIEQMTPEQPQQEPISQGIDNPSDIGVIIDGVPATTEVIGDYKAISESTEDARTVNIALAAASINGIEIAPGETFSFNEVVGDTEADERYIEAPSISGGEMTTSRGGGICQVSTALYIAALKADMEIVERHPHSLVVDYAPIGLDATLVYGVMDLQIKNTSSYPITIIAEANGQTATVKLFGQPLPAGVWIDVKSKAIERYDEQGNQRDIDDKESYSGERTFYVVESYRVYYQNDVETEWQNLYTDTYEANNASSVSLPTGGSEPKKVAKT